VEEGRVEDVEFEKFPNLISAKGSGTNVINVESLDLSRIRSYKCPNIGLH
jgi:hypothetical protein